MGCNRKLWENVTLTVLIYRNNIESFKISLHHDFFLQFSKLDGIHTDSYRFEKNNFLPVAQFWKMFHFLSICTKNLQKLLIWPNQIFFWQIFRLIPNFWKCSKKCKQKSLSKVQKPWKKITKITICFLPITFCLFMSPFH